MISQGNVKNRLIEELNVSRETIEDLEKLVAILIKWNKKINLVGKSTMDDVWARHILDSAQVWRNRPNNLKIWLDIGSGGGFPALVLAIIAKYEAPDVKFILIESDARKCAFLKTVSRETLLNTEVLTNRIENVENVTADAVSARALASVDKLLEYSGRFLTDSSICLFLKGQGCDSEVEKAQESWSFQFEKAESLSDTAGVTLKLWNIKRA